MTRPIDHYPRIRKVDPMDPEEVASLPADVVKLIVGVLAALVFSAGVGVFLGVLI